MEIGPNDSGDDLGERAIAAAVVLVDILGVEQIQPIRIPYFRPTQPLGCGPQSKLSCESPECQDRAGNSNSLYALHLFPVVRQLLPALQTGNVGLCYR